MIRPGVDAELQNIKIHMHYKEMFWFMELQILSQILGKFILILQALKINNVTICSRQPLCIHPKSAKCTDLSVCKSSFALGVAFFIRCCGRRRSPKAICGFLVQFLKLGFCKGCPRSKWRICTRNMLPQPCLRGDDLEPISRTYIYVFVSIQYLLLGSQLAQWLKFLLFSTYSSRLQACWKISKSLCTSFRF